MCWKGWIACCFGLSLPLSCLHPAGALGVERRWIVPGLCLRSSVELLRGQLPDPCGSRPVSLRLVTFLTIRQGLGGSSLSLPCREVCHPFSVSHHPQTETRSAVEPCKFPALESSWTVFFLSHHPHPPPCRLSVEDTARSPPPLVLSCCQQAAPPPPHPGFS